MTKTPTLAAALETFERSPAPAPDTPDHRDLDREQVENLCVGSPGNRTQVGESPAAPDSLSGCHGLRLARKHVCGYWEQLGAVGHRWIRRQDGWRWRRALSEGQLGVRQRPGQRLSEAVSRRIDVPMALGCPGRDDDQPAW